MKRDDGSGGQSKYDNAISAVKSFVAQMDLESGEQQAGLVFFNSRAAPVQQLTSNRAVLDGILNSPPSAGGGTHIERAVEAATAELKSARHSPTSEAIVSVLTDGVGGGEPLDAARTLREEVPDAIIITIGIGPSVNSGMLERMADRDRFYRAATSLDLQDIFDSISTELCIPPTPDFVLECTTDGGWQAEIPLSTGARVDGDEDQDWDVLPVDVETEIDAKIVAEPHKLWRRHRLPGDAKFISHRVDARSRDATEEGEKICKRTRNDVYRYSRTFSLEGSPARVLLDLRALADDEILRIMINGEVVDNSRGGAFSRRILRIADRDAGPYVSGSNTIAVDVLDSGCYMTGLILDGVLHVCYGVPTAPNDPTSEEWPPDPEDCPKAGWASWPRPPLETSHPDVRVNPNNPDEMAFCMKIHVACCASGELDRAADKCGGSPIHPSGRKYKFGDECNPCGAAGLYRLPVPGNVFRLSEEPIVASWGEGSSVTPDYEPITPWPIPQLAAPGPHGQFRIMPSATGFLPFEFEGGTVAVIANGDNGEANMTMYKEIEWYGDPCYKDPGVGHDDPDNIGCVGESTYHWVLWETPSRPETCE